ncbi:MAG: class I SAM-dependent methyltransferase [Acetobacteraceae bacterium]
MSLDERAQLVGEIAARYYGQGRFARHYVAGKLRHDPLSGVLLTLGVAEAFGEVADIGCGRGQFAGLLLAAGVASRVIGVDGNARLLADAGRALRGLRFTAHLQDLAADSSLPQADTVLLVDVLYQLPVIAQAALLDSAARSARSRVLLRTADPGQGWRSGFTRVLETCGRRIWPHSGGMVNPQAVGWIAERLTRSGFSVAITPCSAGTPFCNVLLMARRSAAAAPSLTAAAW